jgi:hypothetical protein
LARYGADRFGYMSGPDEALIAFEMNGRRYAFRLPMPTRESVALTPMGKQRSLSAIDEALAQEQRQRWRALLLIIKAKLEAVDSGIVSLEDEFLAQTVLHTGQTVGDYIKPQLAAIYKGENVPLLPAPMTRQ